MLPLRNGNQWEWVKDRRNQELLNGQEDSVGKLNKEKGGKGKEGKEKEGECHSFTDEKPHCMVPMGVQEAPLKMAFLVPSSRQCCWGPASPSQGSQHLLAPSLGFQEL